MYTYEKFHQRLLTITITRSRKIFSKSKSNMRIVAPYLRDNITFLLIITKIPWMSNYVHNTHLIFCFLLITNRDVGFHFISLSTSINLNEKLGKTGYCEYEENNPIMYTQIKAVICNTVVLYKFWNLRDK